MRKPYQSPGQDEKLILLYCPGGGLNSRPPAHRSFKHGQGVPKLRTSTGSRLVGNCCTPSSTRRQRNYAKCHQKCYRAEDRTRRSFLVLPSLRIWDGVLDFVRADPTQIIAHAHWSQKYCEIDHVTVGFPTHSAVIEHFGVRRDGQKGKIPHGVGEKTSQARKVGNGITEIDLSRKSVFCVDRCQTTHNRNVIGPHSIGPGGVIFFPGVRIGPPPKVRNNFGSIFSYIF